MTSLTGAGSKLAITAASPATFDAAGFTALSMTKIGKVEKIGPYGASFAKVEFQPLDGPKEKYKGPVDNGTLSPSIAIDSADAGQTLLRTAANDKTQTLYSFCITLQDGTRAFFQGRVFGMPTNVDGAGTMVMANPSIEICTDIVPAPAAS